MGFIEALMQRTIIARKKREIGGMKQEGTGIRKISKAGCFFSVTSYQITNNNVNKSRSKASFSHWLIGVLTHFVRRNLVWTFAICLMTIQTTYSQAWVRVFAYNPDFNKLEIEANPTLELPIEFGGNQTLPGRWKYIVDAEVEVDGVRFSYDPEQYHFTGSLTTTGLHTIKVNHPGFRPYKAEVATHELSRVAEVYLARENDLIIDQGGKPIPYPDPRLQQHPSTVNKGNYVPPIGYGNVEGCIVGTFLKPSGPDLKAFAQLKGLPFNEGQASENWFYLIPPAGADVSSFYAEILPALQDLDWCDLAGPLLSIDHTGTSFLTQEVYVEFEPGISQDIINDILSQANLLKYILAPHRAGYLVKTNPALGLDLTNLAYDLKQSPQVKAVEIQLELVNQGDLRETPKDLD